MKARIQGSWLAIAVLGMLLAGCQTSQSKNNGLARPTTQRPAAPTLSAAPNEIVDPVVPEAEPDIMPQTHLAAGRLHESQGHLDQAVLQYRMAVQAKPDWIEALNRLGIVLDRVGRFSEADKAFERAIELGPDQAFLYNNLGFSLMSQVKWPEAEVQFKKALALKPSFARAHVNLAMTLAQQEKFDEAYKHFQTVLRPEDAHYNMGLMYQSKRRLAEAARSFKTALDMNPKMASARKRLEALTGGTAGDVDDQAQAAASPKMDLPLIEPASGRPFRPMMVPTVPVQFPAPTPTAAPVQLATTTQPATTVQIAAATQPAAAPRPVVAEQTVAAATPPPAEEQTFSPADEDPICFDLPIDDQAVTASDFETRCHMDEFSNILEHAKVADGATNLN